MAPLPSQVPEDRRGNAHVVSAYDTCLNLERSLEVSANNGTNIGKDLIYIRVLGYLIHFVPTDMGLRTVVNEIHSARTDRSLLQVGEMYYNHYLRAFRANKHHTPTPSNHSSRRSFDTVADMINDTLKAAPQSYSTARQNALIRDGYRCVVTGAYDQNSVQKIRELTKKVLEDRSLSMRTTQCAHIFSQSTNTNIEPGSGKRDYAATMWAVMERFGYKELPEELNGSKIHRLENVMTLNHSFHTAFDQLQVWFVATGVVNQYRLHAANPTFLRECFEYVTFTTPDPDMYPLPSPKYLAIHAACAQVAHLSGAAGCIDKFYHDMGDSTTLNPNGASAEMLEHAIFELQAAGYPITT